MIRMTYTVNAKTFDNQPTELVFYSSYDVRRLLTLVERGTVELKDLNITKECK